jgi:ribosomal protein L37AE/L43A
MSARNGRPGSEKNKQMDKDEGQETQPFYCPICGEDVPEPRVCGDCGAVICRRCGTPLEKVDELGIG